MVKVFFVTWFDYTPFPGNGHNRAWVGNKIIYGSPRNNSGSDNGSRTNEGTHYPPARREVMSYKFACVHDWDSK